MRIAALYDIHGNLPALDAAIAAVRGNGVDLIVVGGDVFPGPLSIEALDRLLRVDVPCRFIRGNGDRAVLESWRGEESVGIPAYVRPSLRWLADHLAREHARVLEEWPTTLTIDVDGLGRVLFVHATPRNDTDIVTRRTPIEILHEHFGDVDADLIVCGHSHMQFDLRVGNKRIVNAGSVGMPFGESGAHWLLLTDDVAVQRTMYDLDAAAARIRESSHPDAEEFAARYVLARPTEDEMLKLYSR